MSADLRLADKLRAFDPSLPLERARTIPSRWYFDADVYAAECRAVFGDTWQMVALASDLDKPGAYVTSTIANEPVVVLRDEAGELRAFYNVCRHRGTTLLHEKCGTATRLRCRYHGWTYDLAGRLRGLPEFDGVLEFAREDNGLVPLAVDTWGPYVWVNGAALRGRPVMPLAEAFAPMPEKVAPLGLDAMKFRGRKEYTLACNWKVFVDNYLDGGYHVNTVHPALAGVLDYVRYTTETFARSSVQSSPLKPPDRAGELAAVRTGTHAFYWWLFPGFMLNVYDGVMDANFVFPLGPDKCLVVIDFFFDPRHERGTFVQDSIDAAHQIQLEDIGICAEVQNGLRSGSYDVGRFSVRREAGGYQFHRLLAETLRSEA